MNPSRGFVTFALGIIITAAILSSCAGAAPSAIPVSAPTAALAKSGVIRINNPTSPGAADLPFLMALDALKAQGYTVETHDFPRFDLVAPAISKGDLDFASGDIQATFAAIGKGVPVHLIASRYRNPYRVVANSDIKDCAGLNGASLGMSSTTGSLPTLIHKYIEQHCAGTTPDIVSISGSANRVPALVAGQIQAALLELDSVAEVERQAPGKFPVLIDLAAEFPQFMVSGVSVRDEYAAEHPEAVRDFVAALVTAQREVQDRAKMQAAFVKYMGMDEAAANAAADTYNKLGMWDPNGGLNVERVQFTLDLMKEAEIVPVDAKPEQYAEMKYLNEVLDKLGRQ